MKRKLRRWAIVFVLITVSTSCSAPPNRISEAVSEKLLALETAAAVLTAGKNRDYELFSEYAHPEKGIIFSPDAHVSYDEDSVFMAEQIRDFGSDQIYDWGYYDASEDLLELTADEYFEYFVYNKDFLRCRQIGINSILWSGNCPENIAEVFPEGIFVDFHHEGTEESDWIDWASLKIVMEKYKGTFKVVAVINSGYTL